MSICMKTTVDIPDSLLEEAKKIATKQRTSVRALIEQDYDMSWASIKSLSRFNCERSPLRGRAFIPR